MTAKGHKQTFTTVLKKVRFLGKSGHYSPFGKESANSQKRKRPLRSGGKADAQLAKLFPFCS